MGEIRPDLSRPEPSELTESTRCNMRGEYIGGISAWELENIINRERKRDAAESAHTSLIVLMSLMRNSPGLCNKLSRIRHGTRYSGFGFLGLSKPVVDDEPRSAVWIDVYKADDKPEYFVNQVTMSPNRQGVPDSAPKTKLIEKYDVSFAREVPSLSRSITLEGIGMQESDPLPRDNETQQNLITQTNLVFDRMLAGVDDNSLHALNQFGGVIQAARDIVRQQSIDSQS